MVLSLAELSLRAITNGIKNGTIRHPHLLPPKLRERILEKAIKQGVADHPNGLEILTSVEFLTGITSITAKACNDNDMEFLERMVESLATKLPDGQTVGNAVTKLNLKVHDYGIWDFKNKKTWSDVISKVSDLIGQCPNTVSMDLHMRNKSYGENGYWPLNENENIACNRVMENLIKLSAKCNSGLIIDSERPIINFKQLTTFKLDNCYFKEGSWPKLSENIPFVENLHFFDVHSNENGLDWILLSKLPYLKSLEILGRYYICKCTKAFVDTLMECPQLRQVHLTLDEKSTDEESLVQLAHLGIDLKTKIRLGIHRYDTAEIAAIFDSSSRFKLVSSFHKRMESFELYVWKKWNAQWSTALEDVVNTCSNLTSFGIKQPEFDVVTQPQIEFEETKRVNAALVQFFGDPERAQQLKGLRLIGNFDDAVLSVVFENCLNLVRLGINQCSNLRDQHLIDWVSRGGGKLTDLIVEECNNVSSEGIIPILTKSAGGLLHYCINRNQGNSQRNWETVMLNHCPNADLDVISVLLSIP